MKTPISSKISAVACFFIFLCVDAAAATYYVSPAGSDSSPGSEASPWKTIQKAANTLRPGDTVLIRQGTYPERVVPANSGTEGNWITYRNYGSETVVIDAESGARDFCIRVVGKSYLHFAGLSLQGASSAGLLVMDDAHHVVADGLNCHNNRFGIRLYGGTAPVSFITVQNCTLNANTGHGIYLYKKVYDSIVGPHNVITNNGYGESHYGIEIETDYPGVQSDGARRITVVNNEVAYNNVQGMQTWNAVWVWITGNYFHHNGATGIQIEDGSENIVVDDNRSEYNAQTWEYETGIWIDDTVNAAVRRNFLRGNKIGLMITSSTRVNVRNNVILENNRGVPNVINARGLNIARSCVDITAVHNSLYRNGAPESGKGAVTIYDVTAPAVFRNNIVAGTTSPYDLWVAQDYVSDNNVFYNTRSLVVEWKDVRTSWSAYQSASGQDSHSGTADPQFADPASGDFRLNASSPAIDKGAMLARTKSAGSGKTVAVDDVRYFSDGFGIAPGDMVQVGSNTAAQVVAVDSAAGTLTLDRDLSWQSGEGVSYPYTGRLPDIGALETVTSTIPEPPIGLRVYTP
jgi:parallel beta-helix repeat protein